MTDQLSERVKAGMRAARERGVVLGRPASVPPETLERIRQLRARGLSYKNVARVLTREGVPTAHGGSDCWHPSTVGYLVRRGL